MEGYEAIAARRKRGSLTLTQEEAAQYQAEFKLSDKAVGKQPQEPEPAASDDSGSNHEEAD